MNTGFILSALIHGILFLALSYITAKEPIKEQPQEQRLLSLAMFKEAIQAPKPPSKPTSSQKEPTEQVKDIPKPPPPTQKIVKSNQQQPPNDKKKTINKPRPKRKQAIAKKSPKKLSKKMRADLESLLKPAATPAPNKHIAVSKRHVALTPHRQVAARKPSASLSKRMPTAISRKPAVVPSVKAIKPRHTHSLNNHIAAAYKARLQQLIGRNQKYPTRAKRKGDEGTVMLAFVISANGVISQIRVVQSSGNRSLDEAAKKILRKISGRMPFPKGLKKTQWDFTLPIQYSLN